MFFLKTRSWTTTLRTLRLATPALLLCALPLEAGAVPGQGTLYGTSGNPSSFGSVDPNSGVISEIGPTDVGAVPSLAVRSNGTVYGGGGAGNPTLYIIDANDGSAAPVGATGEGGSIGGMDFDESGVLFGSLNILGGGQTGSDHLAIIDPGSGVAGVLGPFGICDGESCSIEGIESLAFDANGVLWGAKTARGAAGPPGLYTINPGSGQANLVTALDLEGTGQPPSGGLSSLQFACDGTLYGGTARAQNAANDGGRLVTVDTSTGDVTFVGTDTIANGTSMASLAFSIPNCDPPTNTNLYGCCTGAPLDGFDPALCGEGVCENNPSFFPPYIWGGVSNGVNDLTKHLHVNIDTNSTHFTHLYFTAGPDSPDPSAVPCRADTTTAGDLTCGFEGEVNVIAGPATIESFVPDGVTGVSTSLSEDKKKLRLVIAAATNPLVEGTHRLGLMELRVGDPSGVVVSTSGTVVGANGDGGDPAQLQVEPFSPLDIYVGTVVSLPDLPEFDADEDLVKNAFDNCIDVSNPDQADTNHDGCGDACTESLTCDLTGDGKQTAPDFNVLSIDFGCTAGVGNCPGDCTGDGKTGAPDFVGLSLEFGKSIPAPGPSGITHPSRDPACE
ncbi:MAG: NHL repeat-containing protein [Planctomycetota bacterium]|jgi:hypothetical protein